MGLGGRKAGRTWGVFYDGVGRVITLWFFYVCRWEGITIWFMNGENQSDIATVVLRMWTVCLI